MKIRLQKALNLTYISIDVADWYAMEVASLLKHTGLYRNKDKQTINRIKKLTGDLIKSVDRILHSDEQSSNFGDDSDFIREVIELASATQNEEEQIQVLSALKMIVKN